MNMNKANLIFMGTPEFAVPVLEMLIKNTNVMMVVTQPDKEVGRHHELTPSPIKKVALEHHIPVFQPTKIRIDHAQLMTLKPDLIITCAYGQIIPPDLLQLPRLGCINVHASLLPKLRGGAPLHHAIIDGYNETGITIMYMDESMDTGDIITSAKMPITSHTKLGDVHDTLSIMGANLLESTLPSILAGTNPRIHQNNSEATYAYNIKREEEHLDFTKDVLTIDRLVRGLNPYPTANILINKSEYKILSGHYEKRPSIIKKIYVTKDILGIGCQDGIYYIDEIKPNGKKVMPIKSFLNGIKPEIFQEYEVE